jgi:hypothetical protein
LNSIRLRADRRPWIIHSLFQVLWVYGGIFNLAKGRSVCIAPSPSRHCRFGFLSIVKARWQGAARLQKSTPEAGKYSLRPRLPIARTGIPPYGLPSRGGSNMRLRLIFGPAFALLVLAAPGTLPTSASSITVNINVGSSISNGRGITCRDGERLLRNRGFRDVRRIDCRGRYFVYRGWRSGSRFEVVLRSRDGRVVSRRRISR